MSLTSWFLVSSGGTRHRLPREMIFVGRDDCELMLQMAKVCKVLPIRSRSVDKQHAVINYNSAEDEHKVKDLGSLNGTFVNEARIPEQTYITLKIDDKLRFGYDTNLFTVARGELRVPEEALKHEKFTSQLQLPQRPPEAEGSKEAPDSSMEAKADLLASVVEMHKASVDISAVPVARGTPLYGQPAWWGEDDADDENSSKQDPKPRRVKMESSARGGGDPSGSKHDDGTQSDTENGNGQRRAHKHAALEDQLRMYRAEQHRLHHQKTSASEKAHEVPSMSRTAFMIEFFDEDNPRKRRSYSFTQIAAALPQEGPHPCPPAKPKGNTAESKTTSLTHQPSLPHAKSSHGVPELHQTKHLQKQKSDEPSIPLVSAQTAQLRSSGSSGHRLNYSQQLEQQMISPLATKENDDDQSDKGTYTIELENSNTEEEEARRMIDTVFGVVDSPNYSGCGITRPVIAEQETKWQPNSTDQATDARNGELSKELLNDSETHPEDSFTSSGPRWMSQWANLAANDLTPATFGTHDQDADISESGISAKSASTTSETASASVSERKRRTLPQLPIEDKAAEGLRPKASLTLNLAKPRREIDEKQDTELPEKETTTPPHQKDKQKEQASSISKIGWSKGGSAIKADTAGDICSETMKSKEGAMFQSSNYIPPPKVKAETIKGISAARQSSPAAQQQGHKESLYQRSSSKTTASKPLVNTTNLINKSREVLPRQKANDVRESRQATATSTLDKAEVQTEAKQKKSEEPVRRHTCKGGDTEKKDSPRPLVRQGSFTIEKPSRNVPLELIPRISQQSGSPGDGSITTRNRDRSNSNGTDSTIDTTTLLKDTESVMAFLEAKLKDENRIDGGDETPSYHRDDSISPESDIDTASTISLVSGDAEKKSLQKRRTLSNLHKEKSFTKSAKDSSKTTATNARDKLADRKIKGRATDLGIRSEPRRSVQTTGRGRQASFDLTDDDQTSSFPQSTISDFLSSDQEAYSSRSQGQTSFTSTDELLHSKLEGNKLSKTKTAATAASKSTVLPKPRPTRASILRRARLGDVSDNELTDVDKVSVVSEVSTTSSTTSKPPSGRKTPSRLDLLAQPRRNRLGSISARSDSEATVTRSNISRSGDSSIRSNLRGTSAMDSKVSPRLRANSISRMPDSSKAKASLAGHSSASVILQGPRWRRFPTDYASTSEDEFGSNRSSPKHCRLRTSTALRSTKLLNSNVTSNNMLLKNKMKEQDDYIRDWTAHSEEIARYLSISKISQDLAKDLAILAREIHDVAGEIDSVSSSGTAPSTTVSTAATTPGSTIDTREEVGELHGGMPKLVDRVFDESLNFRKIPPVPCIKPLAGNGRPSDSRARILEVADQATKKKTWSRDEAVLDSLMLTSVSQLSQKIRHAMEKTALKIRILFKNEDRNWEEIENKMRSESEVPILKTSNKEISSILQELKKVEKQLQAISVMIDPDGVLDSACGLKLSSPSLPEQAKHKTSSTRSPQITASKSDYSNHFNQYERREDKDNSLHE
ncbi:centrosomal protein of 170 kDa isoform X10 [Scyliorhinus torazame]|uniref:centrosomal protein of 170 kDa isoform X10 n=1 Tax=Scyliorhinus torazame TaxID=75743 RepID=UPI003B5A744E